MNNVLENWADRYGSERRVLAALRSAGAPVVSDLTFRKQSHNAVVFQATCDGQPVFIKHYQTDYGSRHVRNTVEETAIVRAQMAGSPHSVVDVLWSCERQALVMMSAAPGVPLIDVFQTHQCDAALADVAQWLRLYVGDRVFEDAFSTSYWLKQRKQTDVSHLSAADQNLSSAVIALQGERARTLGTVPVWKGRLPKDFAPYNLHWSDRAICGFDIEGYTTRPLCRIYANFCILAEKVLPPTDQRHLGFQGRAITPFLEAFCDHTDPPDLLAYLATDLALARFIARYDQAVTADRLRGVLHTMLTAGAEG